MTRDTSNGVGLIGGPLNEGGPYRLRLYTIENIETGWCGTCAHIRGYVHLWCTNEDAIKRRGTSLPGVSGCRNWDPPPFADSVIPKLPWWKVAS